jgi:hypothetical protein
MAGLGGLDRVNRERADCVDGELNYFVVVHGVFLSDSSAATLAQATKMSRGAAVFGGQISLDEIPSDFRADGSSAHAKDVHVIVLDTLLRGKMIVN